MPAVSPRVSFTIHLPGGATLDLGPRTLVMGILNITPDSFSGGITDPGRAAERAQQLEAEGADIIDIGGESTRPGAAAIPVQEELARVLPVLDRIGGRLRVPVSIDTYKAAVARAALDRGAALINDISGLRFEPDLARVAAETRAGFVLMHTRGRPSSMYAEAKYADVVGDVIDELRQSMAAAEAAGVVRSSIIVDPGIGFAKRPEHSYGVLGRVHELAAALGRPLLLGVSRKSFLSAGTGQVPPPERDWGTAAAVTAAILGGAHIVRVHAVAQMIQVVRVADQIRRAARTNQGPGTDEGPGTDPGPGTRDKGPSR